MAELSAGTLLRCFLRSNMINAAFNVQGIRNIGVTYAMFPALRELYPDDHALALSCRRYAVFNNCHSFWSSFLVGTFLHDELGIASGRHDPEILSANRNITLNSISAIGDSFYSGSLVTAYFLILALSCAGNYLLAACFSLLIYVLAGLAFKSLGFHLGFKRGFAAVATLKYLNLINIGDYLKIFSAFTLLAFLCNALQAQNIVERQEASAGVVLLYWIFPVGALAVFSWLSIRLRYARIVALSFILLALVFLTVFSENSAHNMVVF
jgi:PTS system mannose-specific IID component